MDCRHVQQEILEQLDEAGSRGFKPEIDSHLAGCPVCSSFAATQKALDVRLSAMLAPPELSPDFRTALRRRVRAEPASVWPDSLVDKVHFASCGIATLVCAALLPFSASTVLLAGAATTAVSYVALAAIRSSFENAEESGF